MCEYKVAIMKKFAVAAIDESFEVAADQVYVNEHLLRFVNVRCIMHVQRGKFTAAEAGGSR